MATLVEIRPLDKEKWHKQKGKDSFAQPIIIEVLYSKETGGYATGLTEEEAAKYGKMMGVDLSDVFNYEEPHPFWSTKAAFIKLENSTMLLDIDQPANFVKVKNMKASKHVANSLKEYEQGLWPDATHVIYDEHEQLQERATKIETKRTATEKLSLLSLEDKCNIIRILSNKSVKGRSPNFIEVELDEIIETKPAEFIKYVDMGKEEVTIRATVLELLSRNILTREGASIYYMGDQIAVDYEDTIRYFKDPNNTKLKVSVLEKLEIQKA